MRRSLRARTGYVEGLVRRHRRPREAKGQASRRDDRDPRGPTSSSSRARADIETGAGQISGRPQITADRLGRSPPRRATRSAKAGRRDVAVGARLAAQMKATVKFEMPRTSPPGSSSPSRGFQKDPSRRFDGVHAPRANVDIGRLDQRRIEYKPPAEELFHNGPAIPHAPRVR